MSISYSVITDTHGRPWGKTVADFDLGDNTLATGGNFPEAIHSTTANKNICLYGNHDAALEGHGFGSLQKYCDAANKIMVYGFDCASALHSYYIPDCQIEEFLLDLQGRANNYNVIVLTHVPLYPTPDGSSAYYPSSEENYWDSVGTNKMYSANMLVYLLNRFKSRASGTYGSVSYDFSSKTGTVIGCFSGHVHNSVKCYYKSLYMESFTTNGDSEFTTKNHMNGGLYIPYSNQSDFLQHITIDLANNKVNGNSYDTAADTSNSNYDTSKLILKFEGSTNSGHAEGDSATGAIKFYANTSNYPKFRKSHYIGYSTSPAQGVGTDSNGYCINRNDGFWYLAGATLNGIGAYNVTHIRFDASGLLRYYSTNGSSDSAFEPIDNYTNVTITFTVNGYTWKFVNGLYNGYTKA